MFVIRRRSFFIAHFSGYNSYTTYLQNTQFYKQTDTVGAYYIRESHLFPITVLDTTIILGSLAGG